MNKKHANDRVSSQVPLTFSLAIIDELQVMAPSERGKDTLLPNAGSFCSLGRRKADHTLNAYQAYNKTKIMAKTFLEERSRRYKNVHEKYGVAKKWSSRPKTARPKWWVS